MLQRSLRGMALVCFLLLPAGGVAASGAAGESGLVEITELGLDSDEFLRYIAQSNPGVEFARLPAAERARLAGEFAERKRFAELARDAGLDQDPEIRARLDFFADGVLAQAFKRRIRQSLKVTDDDLQEYYDRHPLQFRVPPRLQIEHVIYARAGTAERVRERLAAGDGFRASIAGEGEMQPVYSEVGWFTPDLLISEVRPVVLELQPGQVSSVIGSGYGHHVIRVRAREPGRRRGTDEVREALLEQVRREKAGEAYREALAPSRNKREAPASHRIPSPR